MKVSRFLVAVVFQFILNISHAGQVRNLSTSSQKMPVINLMTGRSTVLRFTSPPKKVIVGNQNYFNIEFVDSDVTIQPLGHVASNLFVYGDGFTYGFILRVNQSQDYDDLVFVRGSSPSLVQNLEEPKKAIKPRDKFFLLRPTQKYKDIVLTGTAFKWSEYVRCFYADLSLKLKGEKINSKDLSIRIGIDADLTKIKPVFESDEFKGPTRVRIFADLDQAQPRAITIKHKKEEFRFNIQWKK
jgi:hypothetical protein